MSVLILVRHGQASLFGGDYDRLSPLGERQSQLLGERWAEWGMRFDQVWIGPRYRHRQTHDAVAAAYAARGLSWPAAAELPTLDEFPAEQLWRTFLPQLIERDPSVRELVDGLAHDARGPAVERLLKAICRAWTAAEIEHPDIESWAAFQERVREAVVQMTRAVGSGKTAAAFTSGGPVAVASGQVLGASPDKTFDLVWMVRNSGYAEILFSGDRRTLRVFNSIEHLRDPALVTFR